MTDVVLSPISSGYNLSIINDNNVKIEQKINEEMLHLVGGNNTMLQDLDMNSNALLNVQTDVNNPDSLLTVGEGDIRYYNITGDTLEGGMNVNGQVVSGLKLPTTATEAVRKDMLDQERDERISNDNALYAGYTAGDASLQEQLNGTNPPMGSAFSVISWHDQQVANSITIPDNKNAWSFGPVVTINAGQAVTVGSGSYWTVANGEVQP
jgi:hypothetical protein